MGDLGLRLGERGGVGTGKGRGALPNPSFLPPYVDSTEELALNMDMNTGEPALPLVCCVVSWQRERCPPPIPCPISGPGVMRVRELAMSLTSCNIRESRP